MTAARILVADDEADVRLLLRMILEQAGYSVEEAGDGAATLDMLHASPGGFDVLLLDLRMPVVDGLGVLRALNEPGGPPAPPVIAVTADTSPAVLRKVEAEGCARHVPKPFTVEDLIGAVEEVLGSG